MSLRIGLIRKHYTPYGGAEVFLQRFMAELLKRGHTLDIFSTGWEESEGVRVHKIGAWGPSFLKPLIFAFNAGSAVDRVSPDVVLSLERTFCQDIYRAGDGCHREWLERRGRTAPWFKRILMRLSPKHLCLLYLEKRLFSSPRLDRVVANSKRVKEDIIRHYNLPEQKIFVIHNGIDASAFDTGGRDADRKSVREGLGIRQDTALLLFVGSGFERKGLLYLIRAMGLLKDRDVSLLVVGKGDAARYIKEAARLAVSDRVYFAGPVKDARRYYRAGDIFILPSIYEPFSNACLEAMAAGLPVVTSRVNGISEILDEGVNSAILDDPADHLEMAGKILTLLDAEKRQKAGESARLEARKHSIERNVSEFLSLFERYRTEARITN